MKRVFAHIGFSFALTLIVLNFLPIKGAFAVLLIACVLFAVSLLVKKTRKAAAVPLCLFSCILAGVVFVSFYYGSFVPQNKLADKKAEISFYLAELPEKTDNGYMYVVKTESVSIENSPQNIKLALFSKNKINAEYNQLVEARVSFKAVAENGYKSYGRYADNIFLSAYAYDFRVTDETVNNYFASVLNLKENIVDYFLENLEGDDAALAIALVTGCRNYISNDLYYMLKLCGIMHIIAVSGLHLSIFAGALYFVLKKFAVPKAVSVTAVSVFVLIYMAFIGFTPSVLRAGIMLLIICFAKLMKQKEDTLNSLGIAVFVICLNPYAVTDVGAMLTVASVLGIVCVYPEIKPKKDFKPAGLNYAFDTALFSISVIVTTLPVMYLFFGYQSFICVFLNIIIIPLIQLYLYVLSFSLAVSGFEVISRIIFYPVKFISLLIIELIKLFSRLYYFVASLDSAAVGAAIGAVFILLGITFIINKNKIRSAALLSAIIFIASCSVNAVLSSGNTYVKIISGKSSSALLVYNKDNALAAGITDYNQYIEICDTVYYNDLTLYMIIDYDNSTYAKKLSQKFGCVNFVCSYDIVNYEINSDNICTAADFNVDLWHGFNVKYNSENGNNTIILNFSDFSFAYTDAIIDLSDYDRACYSASASDYSVTYTINYYGYAERREIDWLR